MNVLDFEFAKKVPGLRAFTTLRGNNLGLNTEESVATVVETRQKLWDQLHLPLERSIFMRQVHADHLEEVSRREAGRGSLDLDDAMQDCDLMISRERGLLLCVGHADCLAVLIADVRHARVGVAHMGWRGASLGVAKKLVKILGSDPADLRVGLSVCLGPCHLELSEQQYGLFASQPNCHAWCSPLKDGHFFLDLWLCAQDQLVRAGLSPEQIEIQHECTACHPDRYYSYRAEAGKTGRMMSCIGFIG